MTRRAAGKPGRILSLSAYVHRATLGLPKAERLDAAAELRAHLLERVAELEGKGFARDEAEFLAVQAMGDPVVTNRQLLGHFFTPPLGWACIGLFLAGIVGWQVASQPKTRVQQEGFEDAALMSMIWDGTLPTNYSHLSFDVPVGTRFLKTAYLSRGRVQESILPIAVNRHVTGYVSLPTWRPWWKTRSPLPYADLPWSTSCHDEQPFHFTLRVQERGNMDQTLSKPKSSNLSGVLWCSGIPTNAGIHGRWWGVSSESFSTSANTPGISTKNLALEHWTPLMGFGRPRPNSPVTDGGVLLVLPTAQEGDHLPTPNYALTADQHFNEWKLTQP